MPSRRLRTLTILLCLLPGTSSIAAPAAWHWWQSKLDGRLFCAQASPGPGWNKLSRPYLDVNCKKPAPQPPGTSRPRFEPGQPEADSPHKVRTQRLD